MAANYNNETKIETKEKICRVCMKQTECLNSLFNKVVINENYLELAQIIVLCASVQIDNLDELPQVICKNCEADARKSYLFKLLCEQSDKLLRKQRNEQISDAEETFGDYLDSSAEFINDLEDFTNENVPSEEEKFKCSTCNSKFYTKKDYTVHLKTHKIFKCKDCGEEYTTKTDLRKHIFKHNNYITENEKYPIDKRTCNQCNKVFQYRSSLLKHIKKHDAPPKTCAHCDFIPATPNKLSQHMEDKHSHLKRFTCTTCGKTFFKEANLKLHLIVHSGVKKHTCEICGMSFALAGNLAAHRRLHTGEKPYTCSDCGRGFTQQSALRSHEAGHSDRRDHICSECGAAFSRAGALRNHCKRHSNEKPFICSMCGQAFTFSSELKRHMTIHTGVKNFTCEVCGRRFNRSTNLRVHKRIHTGETPHVCTVCGKGFIQAHCLRTHMNTHD